MATFNGKVLKKILKVKGKSAKDFLSEMGWKNYSQMVSFMEGNPTALSLAKAASILGVSVGIFFEEEPVSTKVEQTQNNNYGYTQTQSGDINYGADHDTMVDVLRFRVDDGNEKAAILKEFVASLQRENKHLTEEVAFLRQQLVVKKSD